MAFYFNSGKFIENYLNNVDLNLSMEQLAQIQKGLQAYSNDFKNSLSQIDNLQLFTENDYQILKGSAIYAVAHEKLNNVDRVLQGLDVLQFLNKRYGYVPDKSVISLTTKGQLFDRGDSIYKAFGIDFRQVQQDLIDGKLDDNMPKRNVFQKFSDAFKSFFNRYPRLNPGQGRASISAELARKYGPRLEQKEFMKRIRSYESQPETATKEPDIDRSLGEAQATPQIQNQNLKEPER